MVGLAAGGEMKREVITVNQVLELPRRLRHLRMEGGGAINVCEKHLAKALGKRPQEGMRLVLLDLDEWELEE